MVRYDSLKGKVALVTGGTSGIGKDIVKQLLLNEVSVITCYISKDEQAKEAKDEFAKIGNIDVIKADVSNEAEVISLYEYIENKYGRLDYLINNAGINVDSYIEEFNLEDFRKVIDVNLVGKFITIKNSVKLLKQSISPRIINIASRLGTNPMEESMAYCTAEAGIIMLTKVAVLELSKYNIRANTISPSLTLTPLSKQFYSKEEIQDTAKRNPSKRLGETKDIANTAMFLLSDEADYINGENINVSGGDLLI